MFGIDLAIIIGICSLVGAGIKFFYDLWKDHKKEQEKDSEQQHLTEEKLKLEEEKLKLAEEKLKFAEKEKAVYMFTDDEPISGDDSHYDDASLLNG